MIHEQIIHDLEEIIGNNKTSENVYNTFEFAKKAIQNKDVVIEINPKINPEIDIKLANSILGGMRFRKVKSGIPILVFGQKYLDTYIKNSTIHYTVLMHEFKHLYDYSHSETFSSVLNKKERLHYEFEAMKIEAEFIKYYLAGKYNLSKCEDYILRSYEKDNLDSWTVANRKESADIFRILNDLEREYKQNIISKEQLIDKLMQKADQLLEKADQFLSIFDVSPNKIDDISRYGHFIRIKTFEKYLRFIFNDEAEMKEILIKYPEFKNRFYMIHYLLSRHDRANATYSSFLDNYFDNNCVIDSII
jgi:ribosome-binding factor A